jgi:hypothetical protein
LDCFQKPRDAGPVFDSILGWPGRNPISTGDGSRFVAVFNVIMFGFNRILDFVRRFRRAIAGFRKGFGDAATTFDKAGFDAGESLGGIYGKPAFEALTSDNHTVELYDPAVFQNGGQIGKNIDKAKKQIKNAIIRKLSFVAGGIALGVLLYTLLK